MEVVILAGGLGTRLRQVVSEVPKCMAPVSGKPFLAYLLDYLGNFNVEHVVLSVGYLRAVVMEWVFAHSSEYPFSIDFAVEETPLGTGGAVKLALGQCHDDSVVVINGDTIFNVDLDELYSQHKRNDLSSKVSIALKPLKNFDRYGSVIVSEEKVTEFKEKEPCEDGLINGGVYIIDRALIKFMDTLGEKFSFETDVLEPQAKNGAVYGFSHDNFFLDIGLPEDYMRSQYELPELVQNLELSRRDFSKYDTLMLDRDGVINRQIKGGYVTSWAKFEFMPGILEALAVITPKFKHVFVMTNQRGVGKGIMSQKELDNVHARMIAEIKEHGGRIDRIKCCTETDENDPFRKPNAGMFHEVCYYHNDIRPEKTIMIGDSESDVQFAQNCGCDCIQVKKFQ